MEQPVVLITGASRGIGAATAQLAASQGYAVVVNYASNAQAANEVVAAVQAQGAPAMAIAADVSQEAQVNQMFETIDAQWGRLDVLINNAGVLEQTMPLVEMEADRLQRVMAINVLGVLFCCQAATRRMALSRGGRGGAIVNVSSMAARLGSPFEYIDYAASKGAVDTITVGLAKELATDGVRVNGVRPGLIYTDIHASGGDANRVDRLLSTVPMKRGGDPVEVAKAIMWLACADSSYTTGHLIDVSGGR